MATYIEIKAACLEGTLFQRKAVAAVWRDFGPGRLHWSRPWVLLVLGQLDARRKQAVPCAR